MFALRCSSPFVHIYELSDGFDHVMISFYAFHDFNLLFIYLEHKIKGIVALSLKFNFKLFNPETGQNSFKHVSKIAFKIWF